MRFSLSSHSTLGHIESGHYVPGLCPGSQGSKLCFFGHPH